jgi:hypothetical protein
MLKIYRRTSKYELCDETRSFNLRTFSRLVIMDEVDAISETAEFGAYTEEAEWAYFPDVELQKKRKGIKAIYYTPSHTVFARQWAAPNAKLIRHRSYKEEKCSLRDLMELDADKVIAYLKQEGLNLTTPS